MATLSFRQKIMVAREQAIVDSVKRLLADKGFDGMTVDEVAADVGIAKASLYKHFASKEVLAAAAMVQTMAAALAQAESLQSQPGLDALGRLKSMTRWTLLTQLAGDMPSLPSQNSSLRGALLADRAYMDLLMALSDRLGEWIVQSQSDGALDPALPAEAVLYTLYARAFDPVLGFLQASGSHSDEQIVGWVMSTCFDGLRSRP